MAPRPLLWLWVVLALMTAQGCSSLLVKSTPAPVRYQLDYAVPEVSCPAAFEQGLRIWDLMSTSPYDQTGMVVVGAEGQVEYSGKYQWVSPPGTLIAQRLLQDLSRSDLFSQVVAANAPQNPPLELTGQVFTFAWHNTGKGFQPVLNLKLDLTRNGTHPEVVFRRTYQMAGDVYQNNDPQHFVQAMDALMRDFSQQLQEDLCRAAQSAN